MIPTLFHIGPFRVHVYGVMLAAAFLLGTFWARKGAARRGIDPDSILSLTGWILLASILGARLHFVLGHPASFAHPLDFLRIWEGGLTLYGGLVAAIVVSALFLRKNRLPFLPVADAIAPALALGEGIARIGCFLNGCCFGAVCHGAVCVHYPPGSYAYDTLGNVGVYPAQLFLSASMLGLFVALWRADRRHSAPGFIFGLYLLFQGIARYGVDFLRYYEPIDRIQSLSPLIQTKSQVVALLLALGGLLLLIRRYRPPAARGNP